MGEPEYDLFISYAAPDRAWVEGYLRDALDRAEVRVLMEDAATLGHPRLAEFERAVTESCRVVLVLSPAYLVDETAGFVDLLAQMYGLDTATSTRSHMPLVSYDLNYGDIGLRVGVDVHSFDGNDSDG
jgi:hypothetical protein